MSIRVEHSQSIPVEGPSPGAGGSEQGSSGPASNTTSARAQVDAVSIPASKLPLKNLSAATIVSAKSGPEGWQVDLSLIKSRGGGSREILSQSRFQTDATVAPGERRFLGSLSKNGNKVSTYLVARSSDVGIEYHFHAPSLPEFAAAGFHATLDERATTDPIIRGVFATSYPSTLRFKRTDLTGWAKDGRDLVFHSRDSSMRLEDVMISLDRVDVSAKALRFEVPAKGSGEGPTPVDLVRMVDRNYRIHVVGQNIVGVSQTRWSNPSA